MTIQTSPDARARKEEQLSTIILILRFMGAIFVLGGAALFFDLGGLASLLDMAQRQMNQIVGGALMVAGMIDIIAIPRIFEMMKPRR